MRGLMQAVKNPYSNLTGIGENVRADKGSGAPGTVPQDAHHLTI